MRRRGQRVARRTARRRLQALALVLALHASSVASAGEPRARHVDVTITGAADAALEASLVELIKGAGLHVDIRHVEPSSALVGSSPDAIAVVRVDLVSEGVLWLRIVDPRRRRVLVRELPVPHGIDEVVREEASHIVIYAVEAFSRGEDVGEPERPEGEPVPIRPSMAPTARRSPWLELETVLAARTYATVVPAGFGTGAALALSTVRGDVRIGAAVSFEQRSAIVVTAPSLTARFVSRSVRFGIRGDVPLTSSIAFRTSVGAAIDLMSVTTTPLRPSSELRRPAFVDTIPVLDVAGGLAFQLAPRLVASGSAGLELPLTTSDYLVEAERGRDRVLLSPHSVRLVGRLGLAVRF